MRMGLARFSKIRLISLLALLFQLISCKDLGGTLDDDVSALLTVYSENPGESSSPKSFSFSARIGAMLSADYIIAICQEPLGKDGYKISKIGPAGELLGNAILDGDGNVLFVYVTPESKSFYVTKWKRVFDFVVYMDAGLDIDDSGANIRYLRGSGYWFLDGEPMNEQPQENYNFGILPSGIHTITFIPFGGSSYLKAVFELP